ncbi:MAG: hypothetical protein JXA21_25495 [Anaerolineae bacterium]|nr:hypothetical protein [Anaerolineae bacterium]
MPEGVQWGDVDQIQHYHPPDVPYKQARMPEILAEGYDPTKPVLIMIESDGTQIAVGGNHRLAYVRALGYLQIPIRILLDKR